jgi:D-alanyl-D-alanine carboxypeptidase
MESVMENAENQSWLKHCKMKGGSTASNLTKAVYATDKDGNTFKLAYFFDNLDLLKNTRL